jgi:tRNA A37 threonylcarbamoyladenosine dehydratase
MNDLYENLMNRNRLVLGSDVAAKIGEVRVLVLGVGGVGSWCAEALVRSGVRHITVADADIVCPTNLNRQIEAMSSNFGKPKADEMRMRLLEINPDAEVNSIRRAFDRESAESYRLESYDYVIDAIDSIACKALLIEMCVAKKVRIFSSMGAGAKSDPSRIRVAALSETVNCPLARIMRREMRKRNVMEDIVCVFSDEIPVAPAEIAGQSLCESGDCACCDDREAHNAVSGDAAVDWCAKKKRINGALVHITGIFGFMLASLVINDIAKGSA